MKTEALDDKLAETLTEIKFDTLVTLLSEIRAKSLMHTLAARLTDVEIETLGETVPENTQRWLWANFVRPKMGGSCDSLRDSSTIKGTGAGAHRQTN